jgi:hypothetical protein
MSTTRRLRTNVVRSILYRSFLRVEDKKKRYPHVFGQQHEEHEKQRK